MQIISLPVLTGPVMSAKSINVCKIQLDSDKVVTAAALFFYK